MAYTDKVLEHFKNPKNQGSIPDADAIGQEGNPVCGDVMKIYIKVGDRTHPAPQGHPSREGINKEEYIKDIKFETLGCAAAIAVSSALTEIAKGKTLDKALKIKKEDVIDELGGLPEVKIHCSMLGVDALKQAVDGYRQRTTDGGKQK